MKELVDIVDMLDSDYTFKIGKYNRSKIYGLYRGFKSYDELLFEVKGLKDFMVLYEILRTKSVIGHDCEKFERLMAEMRKCFADIVPPVCIPLGGVYIFGPKLENVSEKFRGVLITYDNSSLTDSWFYTNPSLKYNSKMGIGRHKENYLSLESKLRCWNFCMSLKGQFRMSVGHTLLEVMQMCSREEIFYICYLLQFSAKTWVSSMLTTIKDIDSLHV